MVPTVDGMPPRLALAASGGLAAVLAVGLMLSAAPGHASPSADAIDDIDTHYEALGSVQSDLGPPVGDQFGEAGEGVAAALQLGGIPGRSAAWLIVDVRDLAALHVALLEPGRGPRRYMAGGHRVPVGELASLLGDVGDKRIVTVPVPDTVLRVAGQVLDRLGPILPFETPFTEAGMQYYTQMPSSDDSPSEDELGITYRDPRNTLADTVAGFRALKD